MWKKIIVAGTISVALLAGTALAVASNGTQATSDTTEQGDSHWSQMSDYLGDDWSGMVDSMKDVLGDRYGEMEGLMKSTDSNMNWSDMEEFMDGTDMGGILNGSGMEGFDMGNVEDFMGGSGMGGSHMGGTDTGGFMGQSETSGLRSGLNA